VQDSGRIGRVEFDWRRSLAENAIAEKELVQRKNGIKVVCGGRIESCGRQSFQSLGARLERDAAAGAESF